MTAIFVLAGVAALVAFIAYAIYRAGNDPVFPRKVREVVLVDWAEGDRLLKSGEGWQLAPEEDYNGARDKVYLERWLDHPVTIVDDRTKPAQPSEYSRIPHDYQGFDK